jgi:hypothetical protein
MTQDDFKDMVAASGAPNPDEVTIRPDSATHLRAESSLSHHAPSVMTEAGYVPFSVEPAFGKIEPGHTAKFKVCHNILL